MSRYKIQPETMGGELYYMIYQKVFFWWLFFERCNTPESASMRMKELTEQGR